MTLTFVCEVLEGYLKDAINDDDRTPREIMVKWARKIWRASMQDQEGEFESGCKTLYRALGDKYEQFMLDDGYQVGEFPTAEYFRSIE